MANKRVLVTGGAGLIGSFLVEQLVGSGFQVTVVDDFSKGRTDFLKEVYSDIEVREGNLESKSFCKEALGGEWLYIFHLASRAYGIGYSKEHHLDVLEHNERITTNMVASVSRNPPQKLIVFSSSCIYSDNDQDTSETSALLVGEPEIANLGYGWAKRFLEKKFSLLAELRNIPLLILRPLNIYGERYAWQGEFSQAIPMIVKKVLDKRNPVVVWGSGTQRRNYMHAFDCARLSIMICQSPLGSGVFNIGSEDTVSMLELTKKIMILAGSEVDIYCDLTRPEGRLVKRSQTSRLRTIVGIDPIHRISLDDGLRRMIDWYHSEFFD